MKRSLRISLLGFAALAVLFSVALVGIQLIGAASDASYAGHIAIFCCAIAALYWAAFRVSRITIVLMAIAVGLSGAIMPFEIFISMLSDNNYSSTNPVVGNPLPDPQGVVSYWEAVGAIFLIHSVLLSIASLLAQMAVPRRHVGAGIEAETRDSN